MTNVSQAAPVAATKLHGKGFLGNMRLSKITGGKVPCVHVETAEPAECEFTRRSGAWLESKKGWFAKAGQAISLDGQPGGEYITAAKIGPEGAVPCLEPNGRDEAGTPSGMELGITCVVETLNSPSNATGLQLRNVATREVCTITYPHPDGARLARQYVDQFGYRIYCYTGRGAALNDSNGTERDEWGIYLRGPEYCHVAWQSGYEVTAAKRPDVSGFPKRVNPRTPLRWLPLTTAPVAN